MTIHDQLRDFLIKYTGEKSVPLDHPENFEHGDYASPIALALAKKQKRSPMAIAEEIKKVIENDPQSKKFLPRVEVAPPGYLNFFLSREAFTEHLASILGKPNDWGKNTALAGKKIMVEYTDPNPFKEFHIGHLMSNAIGEAISRVVEFSGADVKRANYQGDVGLHVAKAIWGMEQSGAEVNRILITKSVGEPSMMLLGKWYALGSKAYQKEENKKTINEINALLYKIISGQTVNDPREKLISNYYRAGRELSLAYFDTMYKRLGTTFDEDSYFFESETGKRGKVIVEDALEKNIFEQSDGAVVYRGEKKGLHTRVFINSEGLPTYEAKEFGLALMKQERWPHDISLVVTSNEIVEYFRVVLAALSEIDAALAQKIVHVPHGFLRLKSGKMSSRTGEIIRAEDVLDEAKERLKEKTTDENIAEAAAVGAVKYSILRQSAGKDIMFDFATSLSFEGDSGPYLQYTHARTRSVLQRAGNTFDKAFQHISTVFPHISNPSPALHAVERILLWFPDAVAEALHARDPHYIATYCADLAQAFNSFYAHEKIIGSEYMSYSLALTEAVAITLKNGLWLLGIPTPDRM